MTRQHRHGTRGGYQRHLADGETPCDPCYQAQRAYDKRRAEAPAYVNANRNRANAQSRALRDLRRAHPDEYAELYRKHLAAVVPAGQVA